MPSEAAPVLLGRAVLGYEWKRPKAPTKPTYLAIALRRLSEIERLVESCHKGPCDTDDGEAYLRAALPHLLIPPAGQSRWRASPLAWCQRWCPRLVPERGEEWLADLVSDWGEHPCRYRVDKIARMLGVRDKEHPRLDLRTIGAVDMTKRQRILRRKEKHRERQKLARAKKGAVPRELSIAALAPWKRLGISRAGFYRLPKAERDEIVNRIRAQLRTHNQMRPKQSRGCVSPLAGLDSTVLGPSTAAQSFASAFGDWACARCCSDDVGAKGVFSSPLTKSARSDSVGRMERAGVRLWRWGDREIVRAS
jgi:hypothetical protein